MDFTKEELGFLNILVNNYLRSIVPGYDREAEIISQKLQVMKSAVNISNDDVDDA